MTHSSLLSNIIICSGYTQKEFAQKCCDLGVKVRRENINAFMNGRKRPTKEVLKIIAQVCGIDERLLIIDDYLHNAPEELISPLKTLQLLVNSATTASATNMKMLNKNSMDELKKSIEIENLAQFLITLSNMEESIMNFIQNEFNFKEIIDGKEYGIFLPKGIEVIDESMSPFIKKGAKITVFPKKTYDSGDIIAYTVKKDSRKRLHVRTLSKVNSILVLSPINSAYQKEVYSSEDELTILGKVDNVSQKV